MNLTIMSTKLPEPSSVGTSKTTYVLPAGTITRTTPPSDVAENYTIDIGGELFTCNFFQNGDTKVKVAYRIENHDSIAIEFIKATGEVDVIVRHDEHTFNVGDLVKLMCLVDKEGLPVMQAVIRFTNNKTVKVTYDNIADTIKCEEV